MKITCTDGNYSPDFHGLERLAVLALLAAAATASAHTVGGTAHAAAGVSATTAAPAQALAFEAFAPKVKLRWDENFLYVESDGIPAHNMMVGITAWQQQVPLPQSYFGDNAWRIPLAPVPAGKPQTIKGHFLRGAIAIATTLLPGARCPKNFSRRPVRRARGPSPRGAASAAFARASTRARVPSTSAVRGVPLSRRRSR